MNWLITGGCGFIGTNLIRSLLNTGDHKIKVVDNLSVGTRENLTKVCEFNEFNLGDEEINQWQNDHIVKLIISDISNLEIALKAAKGADVILHLAANTGVEPSVKNPREDLLNNIIGTFNYLEAARVNSVRRFIFASSGATIGECMPPIHEEIMPHPASPYGASKLAGEGYCSAYNKSYGIDTVILRFGNVYGPGSAHKNSVIAKFITKALQNEELEIFGDGLQTRDFIFIDDLIDAIIVSSKSQDIGGQIFQIATNSETSIKELLVSLQSCLKHNGLENISFRFSKIRTGDVIRNYSNTTKAWLLLNWKSKVTLKEGLDKTVKWFIQNKS